MGCENKKIIKLVSVSLINKSLIENEYKNTSYIKDMGNKICITSPFKVNHQIRILSDDFFKIRFSSNQELFTDYKDMKNVEKLPQYIGIHGSIYAPSQINFCPIVTTSNNKFVYTYFYPTETKFQNRISDIRKVNSLKLNVAKTGSLTNGVTSSMRSNDIFISKEIIYELVK